MSNYKLSKLEDWALGVDYTGKKLSMEKFISSYDKEHFLYFSLEEPRSDGKVELIEIGLNNNRLYTTNNAEHFCEPYIVKSLLTSGDILQLKDTGDSADCNIYKPVKGKKCFELFKGYIESKGYAGVGFYGSYFSWYMWPGGTHALISFKIRNSRHKVKNSYSQLDSFLYKMFGEHLPPFDEMENCTGKIDLRRNKNGMVR